MVMLFLFLFISLTIPEKSLAIECMYSEQSLEYSLDYFNYEDFEREVNGFPSYDYIDDNVKMCRTEIYVDYQTRLLIISFADTFEWSRLDEGEGRFDFLIMFTPETVDGEFYNVLEYACFDFDQCDKYFVLNHIRWLANVNYTNFQRQLRSTLVKNTTKTDKCYVDQRNVLNCSTGVCLGKYSYYHKNYFFECHQNPGAVIEVHITTYMIVEENPPDDISVEQNQIVRYTCKFNQCNSQAFTDALVKVVENYFSITPMREAFLLLYQQRGQTTWNSTNETILQTSTAFFSSSPSVITTMSSESPLNTAKKFSYLTINLFVSFFLLF